MEQLLAEKIVAKYSHHEAPATVIGMRLRSGQRHHATSNWIDAPRSFGYAPRRSYVESRRVAERCGSVGAARMGLRSVILAEADTASEAAIALPTATASLRESSASLRAAAASQAARESAAATSLRVAAASIRSTAHKLICHNDT